LLKKYYLWFQQPAEKAAGQYEKMIYL